MISTRIKNEDTPISPERKHFGYVIHDLARLLRRQFDAAAQQHELTMPQWRVIGQLSLTNGVSQVSLAGLCDTDPMTISGKARKARDYGIPIVSEAGLADLLGC